MELRMRLDQSLQWDKYYRKKGGQIYHCRRLELCQLCSWRTQAIIHKDNTQDIHSMVNKVGSEMHLLLLERADVMYHSTCILHLF